MSRFACSLSFSYHNSIIIMNNNNSFLKRTTSIQLFGNLAVASSLFSLSSPLPEESPPATHSPYTSPTNITSVVPLSGLR